MFKNCWSCTKSDTMALNRQECNTQAKIKNGSVAIYSNFPKLPLSLHKSVYYHLIYTLSNIRRILVFDLSSEDLVLSTVKFLSPLRFLCRSLFCRYPLACSISLFCWLDYIDLETLCNLLPYILLSKKNSSESLIQV